MNRWHCRKYGEVTRALEAWSNKSLGEPQRTHGLRGLIRHVFWNMAKKDGAYKNRQNFDEGICVESS